MGSCISKCKPKRAQSLSDLRDININTNTNNNQIQGKLVISSSQIVKPPNSIPVLPKNYKITPSPSIQSFKYDFSSASSYSTTTDSATTSESSLSSVSSTASSSILSAKDRSFSNEFLWSCLKENPHVIRINSIKEAGLSLAKPTNDNIIQAPNAPFHSRIKQPNIPPRILHSSTISNNVPQKRFRSSSPITSSSLSSTRQKSFRSSPTDSFLSSRTALRSPSPSRRFSGDSTAFNTSHKESGLKRVSSSGTYTKVNPVQNSASPFSNSLRKDNKFLRAARPASGKLRHGLSNRETCTHRIGSKIDEVAVKEALAEDRESDDAVPMEDIDNPHISLDCFIFL